MTDDAEAAHAELQAREVDVDEVIRRYPVSMFTVRDPDRNRLVIVEEPKGRRGFTPAACPAGHGRRVNQGPSGHHELMAGEHRLAAAFRAAKRRW